MFYCFSGESAVQLSRLLYVCMSTFKYTEIFLNVAIWVYFLNFLINFEILSFLAFSNASPQWGIHFSYPMPKIVKSLYTSHH